MVAAAFRKYTPDKKEKAAVGKLFKDTLPELRKMIMDKAKKDIGDKNIKYKVEDLDKRQWGGRDGSEFYDKKGNLHTCTVE